jgi:1-acyl-sn-glycerol-3-phosphate acyltransferase
MVMTVLLLLGLFASWVVCWFLQLATQAAMLPFSTVEQREDACCLVFRTACILVLNVLNPLWRQVVLRPRPALPANTPHMYMFNHVSNADGFQVIEHLWPAGCKFIGKGDLFKVPFGGWCLRNNGDLEVKFTKEKGGWGTEKGSVKKLMEDAAKLMRRNHAIGLFPEGGCNPTPEGALQAFKPGFFDLAIKEGALIVPCAISGQERMWLRKDWVFGSATGYVSFGDPISPEGHTAETLMTLVHKTISDMRELHPDRTRAALGSR